MSHTHETTTSEHKQNGASTTEASTKKAKLEGASLVAKAEAFVKDELAGNDGSHDWFHIDRVRKLALSLAKEEHIENLEAVELAALLHDIKDWKYSGSESAGVDAARAFLEENKCPAEQINLVVKVIANIGFKTELGNKGKGGAGAQPCEMFPELAVVQDADRLDAIGAIGIGRTFTYGGARKRPMYDPDQPPVLNISKEQYMKSNSPTINHFYEKLLLLKELMKSEAGKRRAAKRHEFMEQFLKQFMAEWEGTS